MRKSITYTSFAAASLLVILVFVTSKTYAQLIIGVLLYTPLVYFAFKIFPREYNAPTINLELVKPEIFNKGKTDVDDVDKRAFLKLIGIAGISFFVFSLINRRASNIPFIKNVTGPEITAIEDGSGNKINPAQTQPTDGYRISEVDDDIISFYGFIKKGGGWFIMKEDTENGSFRYSKGEKEFSSSWENRQGLKYDYYSNVF